MKYLYGASVQGIQDFIFQTKSLAEIVGASELVEEICTTMFVKLVSPSASVSYKLAKEFLAANTCAILNAAGNIKYIFTDKAECEKVVRDFPRLISAYAPGVTVSQAVVEINETTTFGDAVGLLEQRLKVQRNKVVRSAVLGLMGIMRSRQTGFPVIEISGEKYLDKATFSKLYTSEGDVIRKSSTYNLCKKAFGDEHLDVRSIAFQLEEITSQNDWIAVIHADGNGLGNVVRKVGTCEKDFKDFSQKLDCATVNAAVKAYRSLNISDNKVIPIRPIVLGGDDFTVICRGDLALKYVSVFIKEFESETERLLGDILCKYNVYEYGAARPHLTACAGIAFIKKSFPFHYGYELCEELCRVAKSDAKAASGVIAGTEIPQSCIMFHKVQGSYIGDYEDIVRRELLPCENMSFSFGPYYLAPKDGRWTVDSLLHYVGLLKQDGYNAVKSRIRNWISILFENKEKADQDLDRIMAIHKSVAKDIESVTQWMRRDKKSGSESCCPAYDILALTTIETQVTSKR